MPFLPTPAFTPSVSAVPVLGSSSGDPNAKKDPKSVASIGGNIQAMQDQANADTLYDAKVKEGFIDGSMRGSNLPWIVNSQACRRVQGFSDYGSKHTGYVIIWLAAVLWTCLYMRGK